MVEHDQVGGPAGDYGAALVVDADQTGRVARRRRRRHFDGHAGLLHGPAHGDVQGEGTAGQRIGPGQAGLAVGHPDVHATDEEVPVAHAGGPDGVGDEDHAPGHAGHQAGDGRVDVHAVVDHLAGDAGNQRRPDDAGLAVVQGAHAVEQVGGLRGPGVDTGPRFGIGGVGVPDGGHGARVQDVGDDLQGPGQFGGDGHAAHRAPPGVDEPGKGGAVGHQDVVGVLSAPARFGDEGALQMGADHVAGRPRAGGGGVGHPAQALDHRVRGRRDQRHERARGAMPAVEGHRPGHVLGRGGHVVAASAVHVHVNEAGQEPPPTQVEPLRWARRGGTAAGANDPAALDTDPAVLEDAVGGDHAAPPQHRHSGPHAGLPGPQAGITRTARGRGTGPSSRSSSP